MKALLPTKLVQEVFHGTAQSLTKYLEDSYKSTEWFLDDREGSS